MLSSASLPDDGVLAPAPTIRPCDTPLQRDSASVENAACLNSDESLPSFSYDYYPEPPIHPLAEDIFCASSDPTEPQDAFAAPYYSSTVGIDMHLPSQSLAPLYRWNNASLPTLRMGLLFGGDVDTRAASPLLSPVSSLSDSLSGSSGSPVTPTYATVGFEGWYGQSRHKGAEY